MWQPSLYYSLFSLLFSSKTRLPSSYFSWYFSQFIYNPCPSPCLTLKNLNSFRLWLVVITYLSDPSWTASPKLSHIALLPVTASKQLNQRSTCVNMQYLAIRKWWGKRNWAELVKNSEYFPLGVFTHAFKHLHSQEQGQVTFPPFPYFVGFFWKT